MKYKNGGKYIIGHEVARIGTQRSIECMAWYAIQEGTDQHPKHNNSTLIRQATLLAVLLPGLAMVIC